MLFLILVAFVPLAYSLECYQGVEKGYQHPHGATPCQPGAQFCMSQTVFGSNLVTYLCDQPLNQPACRNNGCYQNEAGEQVCCCNTDRCNVGVGGGLNAGHNNGYNNGPHNGPGFMGGWDNRWNSSSKLASLSSLLMLLLTRA